MSYQPDDVLDEYELFFDRASGRLDQGKVKTVIEQLQAQLAQRTTELAEARQVLLYSKPGTYWDGERYVEPDDPAYDETAFVSAAIPAPPRAADTGEYDELGARRVLNKVSSAINGATGADINYAAGADFTVWATRELGPVFSRIDPGAMLMSMLSYVMMPMFAEGATPLQIKQLCVGMVDQLVDTNIAGVMQTAGYEVGERPEREPMPGRCPGCTDPTSPFHTVVKTIHDVHGCTTVLAPMFVDEATAAKLEKHTLAVRFEDWPVPDELRDKTLEEWKVQLAEQDQAWQHSNWAAPKTAYDPDEGRTVLIMGPAT